ncbi:hypothetical protein KSP39_PZI002547 [Platanthera zijinensis]|uniref:Uncharacterized protein n=1 Tax=Platanthera zijinensis TaxID=2320716 RepID=A0AAP0BY50_9ASPA
MLSSVEGLTPETISESVHHEETRRRPCRRSGTGRRKICAAILLHSQSFAAENLKTILLMLSCKKSTNSSHLGHQVPRFEYSPSPQYSTSQDEIDSGDVLGKARSTADEFLRQAKEKSESLKDAEGEMAENAKEVVAGDDEGDTEKFKERLEKGMKIQCDLSGLAYINFLQLLLGYLRGVFEQIKEGCRSKIGKSEKKQKIRLNRCREWCVTSHQKFTPIMGYCSKSSTGDEKLARQAMAFLLASNINDARSTADEFLRQAKEKSESLKDAEGEMAENAKEVVAGDDEGDKEKFKERLEKGPSADSAVHLSFCSEKCSDLVVKQQVSVQILPTLLKDPIE